MPGDSLNLVLPNKPNKSSSGMVEVQIKSEQVTPFGGMFRVMEQFDALLSNIIDSTWGYVPGDSFISSVKSSVLSYDTVPQWLSSATISLA